MALAALVLSTVSAVAWLFTVAAVGYALWRFAYSPWVVMRRDVVALAARTDALDRQLQDAIRIKNAQMTDEEVARIERRFQRRTAERETAR